MINRKQPCDGADSQSYVRRVPLATSTGAQWVWVCGVERCVPLSESRAKFSRARQSHPVRNALWVMEVLNRARPQALPVREWLSIPGGRIKPCGGFSYS